MCLFLCSYLVGKAVIIFPALAHQQDRTQGLFGSLFGDPTQARIRLNILVIKAIDFCLQIGKVTDCAFSSSATIRRGCQMDHVSELPVCSD